MVNTENYKGQRDEKVCRNKPDQTELFTDDLNGLTRKDIKCDPFANTRATDFSAIPRRQLEHHLSQHSCLRVTWIWSLMVGESGNKGRTGADCLMPVLKKSQAWRHWKVWSVTTVLGLPERGGHIDGNGLSLQLPGFLPPSLSSCTTKGAWKTANTPPKERNLTFLWKEKW